MAGPAVVNGACRVIYRAVHSGMRGFSVCGAVVAALCGSCVEPAPAAFQPPVLTLVPAPELRIGSPVGSDCNRPSFWVADAFYQILSNQHAWRSNGGRDAASAQQFTLSRFDDDDAAFAWSDSTRWYVHDIDSDRAPTRTSTPSCRSSTRCRAPRRSTPRSTTSPTCRTSRDRHAGMLTRAPLKDATGRCRGRR